MPTTKTLDLAGVLNHLAGTINLDAQHAANVWAGTVNLELLHALNIKAGNALPNLRGFNAVCAQLAGTDPSNAGLQSLRILAGLT